jgi:hypothetical protein
LSTTDHVFWSLQRITDAGIIGRSSVQSGLAGQD